MTISEHWVFFWLCFLGLWIAYANLMTLYHQTKGKWPEKIRKPLLYILGVPFIILDVIFNIIYGTIMFIELPDFKNAHFKHMPTFTERCSKHLHNEWEKEDHTWRFKLAKFICHYMLEPWDYNHCGLAKLRNGVTL